MKEKGLVTGKVTVGWVRKSSGEEGRGRGKGKREKRRKKGREKGRVKGGKLDLIP